jgi:hypothetical protein
MLLEDGSHTAAVDTMTELWTGRRPDNLAPTVESIMINGPDQVDPGAIVDVTTVLKDPEGSDLRVQWVLRAEADEYKTGGDDQPLARDIDSAVIDGRVDGARVRMPDEPGPYRLFVYAWDDAGKAATANLPLLVRREQ